MKVIAIREAKQTLSGCVDEAQRDHVLITQHGKPAVLLIGVRGHDLEDVMLMRNPRFWELIQARRRETTSYSIEEVREHFGLPPKGAERPAPPGKRRRTAVKDAGPRKGTRSQTRTR